jgi:hypothetical protein
MDAENVRTALLVAECSEETLGDADTIGDLEARVLRLTLSVAVDDGRGDVEIETLTRADAVILAERDSVDVADSVAAVGETESFPDEESETAGELDGDVAGDEETVSINENESEKVAVSIDDSDDEAVSEALDDASAVAERVRSGDSEPSSEEVILAVSVNDVLCDFSADGETETRADRECEAVAPMDSELLNVTRGVLLSD